MVTHLYPAHVAERQQKTEPALAAAGFDALVLSSGVPFTYYGDDQDAPFHPAPHFAHWVPLGGPQNLLLVRPGKRPQLVRIKPEDYWYEQAPLENPYWAGAFDFKEVADEARAWKELALAGRVAYVGDSPAGAQGHGIPGERCNPAALLARLDWERAAKSPYEVACLEEATKSAARGHVAARAAFLEGASELQIHQAYVQAVGCTDKELPYESIVAIDEHGAVLHYHPKRATKDGRVLLIDCGASHQGYGSDITRTWTTRGADGIFQALLKGMDLLQRELCQMVKPGIPYLSIHEAAHAKIADLLHANGLIRKGGKEAVALGLTQPFFPHGVGHFLGILVHDAGGRQKAPEGGTLAPPPQFPYLRTTRTVGERMVFTVEPGLYFIEMLLKPQRTGPQKDQFDWKLIDRLAGHGGIRIEDNVVVTKDGHRNLTRPHI